MVAGEAARRRCVRASGGVNQAEGQNHEDDQADDCVEAIALESEARDGHGDTRDGRGNEEQQAELNQTEALEVRRGEDDSGKRIESSAAGHEGAIVDVARGALNEIENAARQNNSSGDEDADLQEAADDGLKAAVIHSRALSYTFPIMPLTIISMARARTTKAKTARSVRTRACTRTLAPSNAPARTPSMTGMATLGSMNPRLR